MEIVKFEKEMAAGVARCYNELVAPVPYSRAVPEEWFADLTRLERQPCAEQEILVAREAGEAAGFAHVAISAPATEDWHCKGEPGAIRFLSYRPGERPIGAALLEAAEGWVRERGRTEVVGMDWRYSYPFHVLPLGHISQRVSHLPPLLGMAGYEVPESEVFFHWREFEPPAVSEPDVEFELVCEEGVPTTHGPALAVRAKQGARQVGECKMTRMSGDPWLPQFADWCICDNLYVEDPLQGKRLGKYLLARGLAEMRKAGARHALIDTEWDNWRAYLFYTNFGFEFLDRTFGFRKKLG